MQEIASLTSAPLQLIDIGARAGIHPRWRKLRNRFPVTIIGFEADARECATLNQKAEHGLRFLPYALSSKEEERMLHLLVNEGSSSLLAPNYGLINRCTVAPGYQAQREVPVSTRKLDVVLEEEGIRDIDFMKVDTEGYELEILRGASRTLQQVFALELEVWFNPVFEGAPLFREVDDFMAAQGFTLLDVARSNSFFKRKEGAALGGPRGQLVAGDALYFRDLATLAVGSPFLEREKLARSLAILCQYGYYDLAMEFTRDAENRGKLSVAEAEAIRLCLRREGRRTMFDFPGKYTVEKLVKRLGRWMTKFEGDYLGNW